MKLLVTLSLAFASLFAAAQTNSEVSSSEKVAEFTSMLVDYEVVDGKLVALTKRKREYFVYFTNTNGVEVYQTLELKYLSDLFVDCMGNVYVTTIDSAYRLSISDFVQVEEGLDLPTYRSSIKNCEAIFDYTLVRSVEDNMLVVEPIDNDVYANTPELNVIQYFSPQYKYGPFQDGYQRNSPYPGNLDARLLVDHSNAYVPAPSQTNSDGSVSNVPVRTSADRIAPPTKTKNRSFSSASNFVQEWLPDDLTSYKVGDSLWVIDKTTGSLGVYSNDGILNRFNKINGFEESDRIVYDAENESIYFARYEVQSYLVNQLSSNGEVQPIMTLDSVSRFEKLMANNGFIYTIRSKGAVKSIYQTSLKINE